jgi:LysR family transcriptional regulator, cell division regulator
LCKAAFLKLHYLTWLAAHSRLKSDVHIFWLEKRISGHLIFKQGWGFMRPSYDDLSYFLEVANTKNLSRAAERQGITQPSISAAMQRLEQNFDTPLLVRSRSGVQLTKAGQELQSYSRKFMTEWDQLKNNVVRSYSQMRGNFTLGCHPSVALYCLPKLIPQLEAKYPLVHFNLRHDLSRIITEQVISYEIDFALVINPVRHPDLVIHRLFFDEVSIWGKRNAETFQLSKADEYTLLCDPNLKQTQDLLNKIAHYNFRLKYSNNLEVIASLIAEGVGLGILPQRVAKNSMKPLQRVAEPMVHITDELCLVHRGDTQNNDVSRRISHDIRGILTDL